MADLHFKSVAKKQGHALLGGVSHIRHIFTPVAKLAKKTLTEGQVRTLRKQATLKRPAAKERCRDWIMPGGDNKAESVLSHIKQGMRRQQMLGRGGKQPPEKRNVQAMAASALLRTCGIDVVLQAVADYRRSCASGIHKVNPRDCFKNVDWLYELTKGQAWTWRPDVIKEMNAAIDDDDDVDDDDDDGGACVSPRPQGVVALGVRVSYHVPMMMMMMLMMMMMMLMIMMTGVRVYLHVPRGW